VADDREYRIAEYRKAVNYLDLDHNRAFGKVDEDEVESLSVQVRALEKQLKAEQSRSQEFSDLADQMKEVMPEVRRMINRERELDRLKAIA